MLFEAGRLTLELAESLLDEGLGLKDATPSNVLYRAPEPVFVDLLSVEARTAVIPLWRAAGTVPEDVLICPSWSTVGSASPRPRFFPLRRGGWNPRKSTGWPTRSGGSHPLLPRHDPTWLANRAEPDGVDSLRAAANSTTPGRRPSSCRAILRQGAAGAGAESSQADRTRSHWTLCDGQQLLPGRTTRPRERFLAQALDRVRPPRVLDVGEQHRTFSLLAARAGRGSRHRLRPGRPSQPSGEPYGIARPMSSAGCRLARPSPATGWRNCRVSVVLGPGQGFRLSRA